MTVSATACPGLLVSVRSAAEAEAALSGGADLIDVKEPSRGSLGRADDAVITDVLGVVAGRVPVSAAMGEWRQMHPLYPMPGLSFAKWGLAGGRSRQAQLEWQVPARMRDCLPGCRPVFVAYADWTRADSPPPEVLCQLAGELQLAALVIDTFMKDGSTLLDWIPVSRLAWLTAMCRGAGVALALAGSLGPEEIVALRAVRPDWFAVRGAACRGGRAGAIHRARVRELKKAIARFAPSELAGLAIDASRR